VLFNALGPKETIHRTRTVKESDKNSFTLSDQESVKDFANNKSSNERKTLGRGALGKTSNESPSNKTPKSSEAQDPPIVYTSKRNPISEGPLMMKKMRSSAVQRIE